MKEKKRKDESEEAEVVELTPEEQNLKRTLFEIMKRKENYLESLQRIIYKIVKTYPAKQWRGTKTWNENDLEEIYKKIEIRLLNGNLIKFWLASRIDECVIRTNLNNLVFNIIYSMATGLGKLFHSHTANQLKNDSRFIKQTFSSKKYRHTFMRIGLEKWDTQKPTQYETEQLFEIWKKNVKLPAYTSAHKLSPAERAEIFTQMLELAEGYVNSKDFYSGYRNITGFTFNEIDYAIDLCQNDENEELSAGSEFNFLSESKTQTDANIREEIRLAIVEGFDSWTPAIDKILHEPGESLSFLKCFFLETGIKKKKAAENLNHTPSWATAQLKNFREKLTQAFAEANVCKETDQRAFVQLVINKLVLNDSGVNQQCR